MAGKYESNEEGYKTKAGKKQKRIDNLAKRRDKAASQAKNRKTKLGRKWAAKKQARLQNRINKKSGSSKRTDAKTITKTNQTNKSWSAASKKAKTNKATGGASMSDLVKARSQYAKGTPAWKKIQNQINENYGVKKRH